MYRSITRLFLFSLCAAWAGCNASQAPETASPEGPPSATGKTPERVAPPRRQEAAVVSKPIRSQPRPEVELPGFMAPEEPPKVGRIEAEAQFTADPAMIEAAGIRVLEGKHLRLFTDVPSSPAVDELPQVFDAAFPQWCEYFRVDPVANSDWKMKGVLIANETRCREAGLFPESLPNFLHGFARGDALWLLEQPSDYYRRHLLLHEGTHAFMNIMLGGAGPPWYMEGMAEHFGTHHWDGERLETRVMPPSRDATPMWGRLKIIQDDVAAGKPLALTRVMRYDYQEYLRNQPYAWSWAAVSFLDNHHLSRDVFREMITQVRLRGGFSERLFDRLGDVWPQLAENWQIFVANAEYGYDWERNAIVYQEGAPMTGTLATAEIHTDRGWQSTGIRLEAGVEYELTARGRYQVKAGSPPWESEANGVTIHYWKGKPLGQLVGAIRADNWDGTNISPLVFPDSVGLKQTVKPEGPVTLYLKVNESPADLADNRGTIQIEVRQISE